MPKSTSRGSAGGGANSRNVTERPVRYGTPAKGVSPKGVNQIGTSRGNHAMDAPGRNFGRRDVEPIYGGNAPTNAAQKLGNEAATKGLGVGGGRTIHRTGSQGLQGPVAGSTKPQGRDILSEYGSDSPNVAARKR
jgi:hypothetical protein